MASYYDGEDEIVEFGQKDGILPIVRFAENRQLNVREAEWKLEIVDNVVSAKMELPIVYYPRPEYIETDTGNKVSRKSVICGSQNIILGGKTIIQTDCVIRGDLRRTGTGHAVVVAIGRYCLLTRGSIIRPPYKTYKGVFSYYPMKIGDHVTIGEGSVVEAAIIGSFVHIGKNCVIGRFAIIKDCCRIEDNTVISPNTVVPSFSIYEGSPGVFVDELPECVQDIYEAKTKDYYSKFQPKDS
ncbi:11706_t:CDS:2 [Entrophospora sp. SA101]|nr:11706_t:CDS:2 [Entrophospora sp. SA101]